MDVNSDFGSIYCQLSFHELLNRHDPQFSQLENGDKNKASISQVCWWGRGVGINKYMKSYS